MGPDLAQVLGESLYSLGTRVEGICASYGTVPLQVSTYPALEWVLTSGVTGLHLLWHCPEPLTGRTETYPPGGVTL